MSRRLILDGAASTGALLAVPQAPNRRKSLDFVSNATMDGRRFRILSVVDDDTREWLCLAIDTSLT